MVETSNVTAGGRSNPHHPKRTVSTTQIRDWLHEADDLGMPQTAMDCDAPDRNVAHLYVLTSAICMTGSFANMSDSLRRGDR